jgi:hypothetical protein
MATYAHIGTIVRDAAAYGSEAGMVLPLTITVSNARGQRGTVQVGERGIGERGILTGRGSHVRWRLPVSVTIVDAHGRTARGSLGRADRDGEYQLDSGPRE